MQSDADPTVGPPDGDDVEPVEGLEAAETDGVEDEDTSNGASVKPWDPKQIRITTKNFSLREVVDQVNDQELELAPDFQREYVWKTRQRTRLVESILLGIPLPAFYFNQNPDGTYQVVDGVQRLSTVHLFMSDQHTLDGRDLEYLRTLTGLTYSKLDPTSSRRFKATQIVVHVIEPQTPEEVKYDIFNRVNTLGSPLSAQEIRHAMSKKTSREFLRQLVDLPSFDRATAGHFWRYDRDERKWVRDSKRMMDRELALRFCAFRSYSEESYRAYDSFDRFLVDFLRRVDARSDKAASISDTECQTLHDDFNRAMTNAAGILGKAAFRHWPPSEKRRGPLNRAVFESQALALANFPLDRLLPKKDGITVAFRKLFDITDYARAVTVGTGDIRSIRRRLTKPGEILEEIVG